MIKELKFFNSNQSNIEQRIIENKPIHPFLLDIRQGTNKDYMNSPDNFRARIE